MRLSGSSAALLPEAVSVLLSVFLSVLLSVLLSAPLSALPCSSSKCPVSPVLLIRAVSRRISNVFFWLFAYSRISRIPLISSQLNPSCQRQNTGLSRISASVLPFPARRSLAIFTSRENRFSSSMERFFIESANAVRTLSSRIRAFPIDIFTPMEFCQQKMRF